MQGRRSAKKNFLGSLWQQAHSDFQVSPGEGQRWHLRLLSSGSVTVWKSSTVLGAGGSWLAVEALNGTGLFANLCEKLSRRSVGWMYQNLRYCLKEKRRIS